MVDYVLRSRGVQIESFGSPPTPMRRLRRAAPRAKVALLAAIASWCVTAVALASEGESEDPPTSTPAAVEPVASPTSHHGSAFIDPLGFLLFGPTFGVEVGVNRFSATLYGRWLNAGVLAKSLFLDGSDTFAFSYGAGLRGRYFFSDNLQGPHVGLGLEFVHSTVENTPALISTKSGYLVPLLEGGYRLPLSSSFYLGAAAGVGYAFQLSSSVENLPGGSSAGLYAAQDKSTIYGSASLEAGVYF